MDVLNERQDKYICYNLQLHIKRIKKYIYKHGKAVLYSNKFGLVVDRNRVDVVLKSGPPQYLLASNHGKTMTKPV